MKKSPAKVYYAIPRSAIEALSVYQVLDMLRYDSAKVEHNPPDGCYMFSSEAPNAPCVDRWRSFGVVIDWKLIAKGENERYRMMDTARAMFAVTPRDVMAAKIHDEQS